MAQNTDFILELLQENGMVTEEQVSEGWKKVAEQDGQINIIDALKQLKYVDEFEMISMLAQQYGLEVLDLSTYRIPPEVIETVPREIVQQYKIVPVMKHDDVLTIAMSDPTDMATLDSIRFLMKCDVDAVISPMDQIKTVMEKCPDEMAFFNAFVDRGLAERLTHVANSDFGRVSYTEAVELLKQNNDKFDFKVEWGCDLQTEHERYLTEQIFQKPVFVTDYPKEIKAFYMRLNDDGRTVAAADCLVPGIGEIIGGSQREERLDLLEARIRELGMNPEDYWWYLDLRRYGGAKHAGFGLGFERMVMYLTGIANIRDVLPHPRTVGNADF